MQRFLVFVFLLGSLYAHTKTYYVSNHGNDNNNGSSISTPWKTVAKVNSFSLVAGDIVLFQRGSIWRETLIPSSSGLQGKVITFSDYGSGPKPVFNGGDIVTDKWVATEISGIWLMKSSYFKDKFPALMVDAVPMTRKSTRKDLVLNSFYVDKSTTIPTIYVQLNGDPKQAVTEISVRDYAVLISAKKNISIQNFVLLNCLYAGLRFDGKGVYDGNPKKYFEGYSTAENISVSNCVQFGIVTGNGYSHTLIKHCNSSFNGNGYYSDGEGNNNVFQFDTAYGNHRQLNPVTDGNGFGIYKSSFNVIENCLSYNNKDGSGIEVDLANTDSSIVIRYNTTYGNGSLLEGYGIKTGNCLGINKSNTIYYNLSYLNGNDSIDKMGREFYHQFGNISFYNNTAFTTGKASGYALTVTGTGNVRVVNNIFYSFGNNNTRCIRLLRRASITAFNNLYYSSADLPFNQGNVSKNFIDWQKSGFDNAESQITDPKFMRPGNDFRLQPESPGINKGFDLNLGRDILGKKIDGLPDLGAFESTTSADNINLNPVAETNNSLVVVLPDNNITLDGSTSYDPDGNIVSYEWQQLSGPSASLPAFATLPLIDATNLVQGEYTYLLTVTDNQNAPAQDTVHLLVEDGDEIFKVFPNPATSALNLYFKSDNDDTGDVMIFDINGKSVLSTIPIYKPQGRYQFQIDIQNLIPGSYVATVIFTTKKKMSIAFLKF